MELNGRLLEVVKYSHVNAGRQLGSIQVELRDVLSRTKQPAKFRPSESVEVARLMERTLSVLYREGDLVHVMDGDTFEQSALSVELFGDQRDYLLEGMDITLSEHEGRPILGEGQGGGRERRGRAERVLRVAGGKGGRERRGEDIRDSRKGEPERIANGGGASNARRWCDASRAVRPTWPMHDAPCRHPNPAPLSMTPAHVPPTVTLKVAEAAPTMKGETAAPSYKPAVLENGVRLTVPPFVNVGDSVVVDTTTSAFMRRA